jgi:hypothetical protein
MRPHDMKYIGFKHQRENKQNSDNEKYQPARSFILSQIYQPIIVNFLPAYVISCSLQIKDVGRR